MRAITVERRDRAVSDASKAAALVIVLAILLSPFLADLADSLL